MSWNYSDLAWPTDDTHNIIAPVEPACTRILPSIFAPADVAKHPATALVNAGHLITAVTTEERWSEEHEVGMNVVLTIDDKKYGGSLWCMDKHGVDTVVNAEAGDSQALSDLNNWVRGDWTPLTI